MALAGLAVNSLFVLALVAWATFDLPALARTQLEGALAEALGAPVAIEELSWRLAGAEVEAAGVTVGEEPRQIQIGSISLRPDLAALLRGTIAVERLTIAGAAAELVAGEDQRLSIAALPPSESANGAALPAFEVHEVVITDSELTVHRAAAAPARDTSIRIGRLVLTDLRAARDLTAIALAGTFEGGVDGARLEAGGALRLAADEREIALQATLVDLAVDPATVPLPDALAGLRGRASARAEYSSSAAGGERLRVDLQLTEPSFTAAGLPSISARRLHLPRLDVDLARARVDLGPVAVEAPSLTLGPETAAPAPSPPPSSGEPAWSITGGPLEIRGGALRLRRHDRDLGVTLQSVRWLRLGDDPAPVSLRAEFEDGGTIEIEGTAGAAPPAAEITLDFAAVELPPLARWLDALPLPITRGSADGRVEIAFDGSLRSLSGTLEVRDLHTGPPRAEQPIEVMAVHRARAALELDGTSSPSRLAISSLDLSYPYVMIHTGAGGTFPFNALGGNSEASPAAPLAVDLGRLEIEGGKLELMDTTLAPPFWSIVSALGGSAEGLELPAATVRRFDLEGMHNELSPARVSGSWGREGIDGRALVRDVLLESLNAYIAPLLGFRATRGRLTLDATVRPAAHQLHARAVTTMRSLRVEQTAADVILAQTGVPLPIALSLIAKPSGEIELTLPVTVDTASRSATLGSVVGQAVRSAIVGALTSPLRLLGSLFGTRGAPHAFAIDPIPFPTGSAELEGAGWERIAQIARIVRAHDQLLLVLLPQLTDEDIDIVGDTGAALLARDRAAAAEEALQASVGEPPLPPRRLLLTPWSPAVGAAATGRPGVYVELQEAGR